MFMLIDFLLKVLCYSSVFNISALQLKTNSVQNFNRNFQMASTGVDTTTVDTTTVDTSNVSTQNVSMMDSTVVNATCVGQSSGGLFYLRGLERVQTCHHRISIFRW